MAESDEVSTPDEVKAVLVEIRDKFMAFRRPIPMPFGNAISVAAVAVEGAIASVEFWAMIEATRVESGKSEVNHEH